MPSPKIWAGLLVLAWVSVIGCAIALWSLGRFGMPSLDEDAGYVALHLLGVIFILMAAFWIKPSPKTIPMVLVLVGAWCVIGVMFFRAFDNPRVIRFDMPSTEVFLTFLALCVLGGFGLLGHGLFKIRSLHKAIPMTSIVVGTSTLAAVGVFVHQVLSNDETDIAVVGSAGKPTRRVNNLRLLDLNVLHGYPDFEKQEERFYDARRVVEDLDIVVLQEVWNTDQHGNMAEGLLESFSLHGGEFQMCNVSNYAYARANGSRSLIAFEEGGAVMSKFPILKARRMLLKPREPWWENRIFLVTKLDLGGDETLTVVGVHLSNSASADDQAEYLMDVMKDVSPDIIAGDFNSEPQSRAIQAVRQHGFVEAVPTKAIHGAEQFDLPCKLVTEPIIDHVFFSPAFLKRWQIKTASWVVTSKAVTADATHARMAVSDHDAILVDLERR
jgi:endonuclease/exonuclease/phosphatase family metal-dependent hydrolase